MRTRALGVALTLPLALALPTIAGAARCAQHASEEVYDLARPELEGFLEALRSGGGPDDYGRYLSPSFSGCTPLRPADLTTLVERPTLTIRRAEGLADDRRGRDALPELLAEFLRPFGPTLGEGALRAEAKIFTTLPDPRLPSRFTTRALVHFDGLSRTGGPLQVNMTWSIDWDVLQPDTGTIARIRSIRVERYEEVATRGALFEVATGSTLGRMPNFAEEFEHGAAESHQRRDLLDGDEFTGTSGLAVGDVNGDGLEDLFIARPGGTPNRLLLHEPGDGVRDVSAASNLDVLDATQAALLVDLDNDGDRDLAMASGRRVWIGRNDGKGHMLLDDTPLLLRSEDSIVLSLAAADWDGDADLDLYACAYAAGGPLQARPMPYFDATNGPPNAAWRNDGEDGFRDVTEAIGLDADNHRFSHAALFDDFDDDGDVDLYVVNDFGGNDLYRNENGRFEEVADEVGARDIGAGMGVSAGDVDRDGDIDLFVANTWSSAGNRLISELGVRSPSNARRREELLRYAQGTSLLLNRGDGTFAKAPLPAETRDAGWNFGTLLVDLNNDGALDLYAPNGFLTGPVRDDL